MAVRVIPVATVMPVHVTFVTCTHIVMEAYTYIIDNDEDVVDFLGDRSLLASVIEDFKGLYERLDRTASWFVLIGDWPMDNNPSFTKSYLSYLLAKLLVRGS